jgi:hypothetical protein
MTEKFNLKKMLLEIQEDEKLGDNENIELSQDRINQIMIERLQKRKAKKE